MARLVDVSVARIATPLHTPFVTALRRAVTVKSVVVRLTDDDGRVGFGEAPEVWRVTGESIAGISACVLEPLADVLLAWDPDQPLDRLTQSLDEAVVGNFGAKSACATAMTDLVAWRAGLPVHRLLGAVTSSVVTDVTIAADAAAETTTARMSDGFRHLKVKVGVDPSDVDRVRRIHDGASVPVRIRIDANQSWDFDTTVAAVTTWIRAGIDLEFIEQPLPRWDLAGHARLRRAIPTPVMLDESVFSLTDLYRALDAGSADLVNIKLAKCGGPLASLELARHARSEGLGIMVGSMLESNLGVSAAAAVAATAEPAAVHDLDAAWWSVDPRTPHVSPYRANLYLLNQTPGLSADTFGLQAQAWRGRA
jgi:L-Ala-D/L-Glu epimerase